MFEISVIVTCLFLNAVLSCIEMAFVTVSKPLLRKYAAQGDKLSKIALELKSNPERVLSVLQIGITMVGAISAAVGGAGAEETLSPFFQVTFGLKEEISESLAIISVIVPLTFFSVVIGELVPKSLAIRFPVFFTRVGSYILVFLDKLFSPVVFLLELSTKVLILPFSKFFKSEPVVSADGGIDIDNLNESHRQYVFNLIAVHKKKVKDIILPWQQVTKIEKTLHYTDVLSVIRKSRHTRIPVIDDQNIVGILHSKEYISEVEVSKMNWLALIRDPIYISAEEPILSALKTLQNNKIHMGIVKEKDQVIGIVTLEDIFEEVVGEINDEDDNIDSLLATNSILRTMQNKR